MNTVGKKGKLGEHIRCVVSVAMLTEGWDANTVTHILGIRAFRSQLLCEQVVGRGLRRRSYAVNDDGRFDPEYAEVYGVPFAFIPGDRPTQRPETARPAVEVRRCPDRGDLRITFPKLDGYRVEIPDEHFCTPTSTTTRRLHLDQATVAPAGSRAAGIVGEAEELDLDDIRNARPARSRSQIAKDARSQREQSSPRTTASRGRGCSRSSSASAGDGSTSASRSSRSHDIGIPAAHRRHAPGAAEKALQRDRPPAGQPRAACCCRSCAVRLRSGSTDDVRFFTRKVVMIPTPTEVAPQPRRARRPARQHLGGDPRAGSASTTRESPPT